MRNRIAIYFLNLSDKVLFCRISFIYFLLANEQNLCYNILKAVFAFDIFSLEKTLMTQIVLNKQLGTKWFTFYAKVRPWLSCVTLLTLLLDFFRYPEVYFSSFWFVLYLLLGIAQPILAIIVFTKSGRDYEDFVNFVRYVLIFEVVYMVYESAVEQYLETLNLGLSVITAAIVAVVGYFLWYHLNIKYFEKRMLKYNPSGVEIDIDSLFASSGKTFQSETHNSYDAYSSNADNTQNKVHFCKNCGQKLPEDANFCTNCGTKIS